MLVRDARDGDMAEIQAIYAHHVLHGTASFEEEAPPPSLENPVNDQIAKLRLALGASDLGACD